MIINKGTFCKGVRNKVQVESAFTLRWLLSVSDALSVLESVETLLSVHRLSIFRTDAIHCVPTL